MRKVQPNLVTIFEPKSGVPFFVLEKVTQVYLARDLIVVLLKCDNRRHFIECSVLS